MDPQKVLIIKTGYSEILEGQNNSREVSFGDILRSTILLHNFKEDNVTWVTDEKATPLLINNPYISSLLIYDFTTASQLESEHFDTIINLEKIPGICALADKIKAWRRFGFRFNSTTGKAEAYDKSFDILNICSDMHAKKDNKKYYQQFLFEMVGKNWNGEGYILGYKPTTQEIFDVALNNITGSKWPTKAWPKENWDTLEEMLLKKGIKTSRQDKQDNRILTNLYAYTDWINSCKTIITCDSLGMHLGLALKKNVIALFGPTPNSEVYFYDRGRALLPKEKFECLPCFKSTCDKKIPCMNYLTPNQVYDSLEDYLEDKKF